MLINRKKLPFSLTYVFMGAKMNYRVIGKGSPVILLHGSVIHNPWNGFEKVLAKHHRVYLPELPGFGGSEPVPNQIHNNDLFAQALNEFIVQTKLKTVPLIALSLGTIVTLKMALLNHYQGKLILVGLPTHTDDPIFKLVNIWPLWVKRLAAQTKIGREQLIIPFLLRNTGIPKNRLEKTRKALVTQIVHTHYLSLTDPDYYNDINAQVPRLIKQVKNPIVLVYGENDPLKKKITQYFQPIYLIPGLCHDPFAQDKNLTLKYLLPHLKN